VLCFIFGFSKSPENNLEEYEKEIYETTRNSSPVEARQNRKAMKPSFLRPPENKLAQ